MMPVLRFVPRLLGRLPLWGLVLLAIHCSWNAPRDNPLDPNLGGNVQGRVLTRRATGITDAEVLIPDAGRVARTDSTGRFELYGLPEDSLCVHFLAEGYVAESLSLGLKKGRIDSLTVDLDGLPFLRDNRVTTHVYDRGWPPEWLYFCRLSTSAGDQDGDVDVESVWVEIPSLDSSLRLPYDPEQRLFASTLGLSSPVPGRGLETLVGQSIRFHVVDREGVVAESPDCHLSRVIEFIPEPLFPAGGADTLSTDTTFVWRTFDHGFWVRYHGEIVRIEGGGPAGVAATFDISVPSDTTFRYHTTLLDSGDYYCTIEAIDAFGNSARSPEERFHAH